MLPRSQSERALITPWKSRNEQRSPLPIPTRPPWLPLVQDDIPTTEYLMTTLDKLGEQPVPFRARSFPDLIDPLLAPPSQGEVFWSSHIFPGPNRPWRYECELRLRAGSRREQRAQQLRAVPCSARPHAHLESAVCGMKHAGINIGTSVLKDRLQCNVLTYRPLGKRLLSLSQQRRVLEKPGLFERRSAHVRVVDLRKKRRP